MYEKRLNHFDYLPLPTDSQKLIIDDDKKYDFSHYFNELEAQ